MNHPFETMGPKSVHVITGESKTLICVSNRFLWPSQVNPLFLWNMTCGTCFEWAAEQCGTQTGWELIYITSFQVLVIKYWGKWFSYQVKWLVSFTFLHIDFTNQVTYYVGSGWVFSAFFSWNLSNTLLYSEEDQQKLT